MLFLVLVLTFPLYTALTAMTMGGRSKIVDDVDIKDPTLRAMGEMLRKKESNAPETPITPTPSEPNAPETPHTLMTPTPSEPITSTAQAPWQ